jgi:predicted O-methyltransferase YrrM
MKEALMVDKITSWKFVEEFSDETPAMHKARIRAEEIGVECITAATGAQLAFTVASLGAKAIVEVGTGTGLSGLWLLHGSPDATLATIDTETEHQAAARLAFADAKIASNRTRIISGRADEVMSNMADAAYDLVLLDAGSESLGKQIAESTRLLRPGGAVAIVHALWRDRVPDPAMRDDATVAYRDALSFFANNESFVVSLLAIGDGLLLASKR